MGNEAIKMRDDEKFTWFLVAIILAVFFGAAALSFCGGFKSIEHLYNKKGDRETMRLEYTILGNDMHRISISREEFDAMCACVMQEAGGEPYEAQEAVAQSILNRWLCEDKFPDTIIGVLQDPGAYTKTTEEPTVSVKLAVSNAIAFYNTFAMNYPKTMYYFRDTHYHIFGIQYRQIGALYFSLAPDATD
jgi:hypothetical protein